jgi:hypothetical protein
MDVDKRCSGAVLNIKNVCVFVVPVLFPFIVTYVSLLCYTSVYYLFPPLTQPFSLVIRICRISYIYKDAVSRAKHLRVYVLSLRCKYNSWTLVYLLVLIVFRRLTLHV